MLTLMIPETRVFNDITERFFTVKARTLVLEHSLVSLSRWESEYKKPFLDTIEKTAEETYSYIRHMTITQNVDEMVYRCMDNEVFATINEYIDDPMTATTFRKENSFPSRDIITAEIIYYWMTAYNIPTEYQRWHLNRLLTLIRVCNVKNQPKKKMNSVAAMQQTRDLNAVRRKQHNTRG